jgi:hypothetical protein
MSFTVKPGEADRNLRLSGCRRWSWKDAFFRRAAFLAGLTGAFAVFRFAAVAFLATLLEAGFLVLVLLAMAPSSRS